MKMVKTVVGDYFLIFALIVSLLTWPTEFCASTFASGSDFRSVRVEDDGSPQTIPTQKRKSKRKARAKRKSMIMKNVSVPVGAWGGDGIILNIEANGATIEYVCADGRIEQALKIDGNGNFAANGFHNPEQPGPISIDAKQTRQPAHYEGKISGDTMTLKVSFTGSSKVIGEFTLVRGRTPRMTRCY
jgi:hypothetical protein